MTQVLFNPNAKPAVPPFDDPGQAPLALHQRLPGYERTPLHAFPDLANDLGVAQVWLKDETRRLELPAFKILGASWAAYQLLAQRLGRDPEPWHDLDNLKAKFELAGPVTLVTASDGNHGRAVAHAASLFGAEAHVYLPAGTVAARRGAILEEGATVTMVGGTYEDAVARAAASIEDGSRILLPDTSRGTNDRVPNLVTQGYSTLFHEVDAATTAEGEQTPNLLFLPVGVGALAAAALRHYRASGQPAPAKAVAYQPESAASLLESLKAGQPQDVPGPHGSIMAGLNCGHVSPHAWPTLEAGIDAAMTLPDDRAKQAMQLLASVGIAAGETGAAGLGALIELLDGPNGAEARSNLHITPETRILLIATEGPTDPRAYREITGQSPEKTRGEPEPEPEGFRDTLPFDSPPPHSQN